MALYGLYDIKNNEQCVAIDTAKELCRKFNINLNNFKGCVKTGYLIHKKYQAVKVEIEDE